jgi:hypothetical protein
LLRLNGSGQWRKWGTVLLAAVAGLFLLLSDGAFAQPADWTLEKTATPTTYTAAGQVISYTYVITDNSGFNGTVLSFTDDRAGTPSCPSTTVPANGTLTCNGQYTILAADITAGSVTNTATVTGCLDTDGCITDVSATDTATVTFDAQPSWTLEKTPAPLTYAGPGEEISYSYELTNTGNVGISAISIDDDRIAVVTCPSTTLAAGDSMTCTGTYTTTEADVSAGSVTNTATATGTPDDGVLAPATAQATITFAAAPAWTLTKTPNPTTYTAAGQVIDYAYLLTNTGNTAISAISITDDRIAVVTCPSTTLAAGKAMTCTGAYTTTEADVTAGSVTNIAIATGTPAFGQLAPATDQATITFAAPPTGSITVVKTAIGGDDTFSFTSTVAGAGNFDLTTAGGAVSRNFSSLTPSTYTFTEVGLPPDWDLTDLSCTGDTGGTPTTVDLANRRVSVGLDSGEAITCTFENTLAQVVPNPIRPFLTHRLTFLADGPDRHRIFRRIPGSLWGDATGGGSAGSGGGPFAFVGSGNDNGMQMSVATSLLDLSETYAQANGTLEQLPTPSVDVWLEVHYSEFEDEDNSGAKSEGHFGVAYVGIDYLVTPTVLVGILGQIDWGEEDSNLGSSVDGVGGMAGPYLSARLTPNLFFTTRAAYGISENNVSPIGTFEDDFSTDRWLASAEFTGNWNFGNLRITPTASVTYLQEDQHGYTDSLGTPIPSQTVSLGQLSFGPEIAYRFVGDRYTWEPHISVNGLWDFDDDDGIVAGLVATDEDLRAKVKAGILAQAAGGASLRVVGTFDGIGGDGFEAFGGQAWLSIPLR